MKKQTIGLLVVITLFLLLVGYQINRGMQQCDGHFIYPLDDPYIHLMLAKNVAEHSTWGFNPGEFASSSSSLLYTILLSVCIFLFGKSEWIPLIVNILAGVSLLVVLFWVLQRLRIGMASIFMVLIGVIFLVPLLSMVVSGMEHTLQLLINVLYFYVLLTFLSSERYQWNRTFLWLCVLSALTVMVRFEALFFIPIPFLYLLFSKRIGMALTVGIAATLPVIVFGLFSLYKGAYFLPNSLIIKGQRPDHFDLAGLVTFAFVWLRNLAFTYHLLVPFILLLVSFVFLNLRQRNMKSPAYIATFACLVYYIAHLQFAKTGWFYRYESYLVLFTFITFALVYKELVYNRVPSVLSGAVATVLILVGCMPLYMRGYASFIDTGIGMRNVYEQQYQMALFIHRYYPNSAVAANDVGAITYLNNITLVDLYGLGSTEVLTLKIKNRHNKESIDELVKRKGVKFAVVYDEWFENSIPDDWTKVAEWTIRDNVVCAHSRVCFYAVNPEEEPQLVGHLKEFEQEELPEGVMTNYPGNLFQGTKIK